MDSQVGYSPEAYRSLLLLAVRRGWQFRSFMCQPNGSDKELFLRHDVDYSLQMALDLARINQSVGVQGTFFLLLRSGIYNLLAEESLATAREIVKAGQMVGLHFAIAGAAPESKEELQQLIRRDFGLLQQELPHVESVFSWHNPPANVLGELGHFEVPGLINTYGRRFTADAKYASDSNLRNSVSEFQQVLSSENSSSLQLLFHPLNWIAGGRNMFTIFARTWKQVIREREREFLTNRFYRSALPRGMPDDVLESFAREWHSAACKGEAVPC